MRPLAERFYEKVFKTEGCHFWIASTNRRGYGTFLVDGVCVLSHRVAWLIEHGSWPEKYLMHTCDTPQCIRLDHLVECTIAENNRDASRKGLRWSRESMKPFCKRGHRRIPENLYKQPSTGWRRCRICFNERLAKLRQQGAFLSGRSRPKAQEAAISGGK